MGYSLNLVVSSAVDVEQKGQIVAAALARWPQIALPAADVVERFKREGLPVQEFLDRHVHFAADPEPDLKRALPKWSREFPKVIFTFIELECFGGDCGHWGYVCQAGKIILRDAFDESPKRLLQPVGITLDSDYFAPFVRGYFPEE